MTGEELYVIKKYQREFQEKFNKKLEIDWNSMKGIIRFVGRMRPMEDDEIVSLEIKLNEIVNRNNASLDKIKTKRLSRRKYPNEQKAIVEFSVYVMNNGLNIEEAARLINKDRSGIYYYAGRR